jgi:hypothetical protein
MRGSSKSALARCKFVILNEVKVFTRWPSDPGCDGSPLSLDCAIFYMQIFANQYVADRNADTFPIT